MTHIQQPHLSHIPADLVAIHDYEHRAAEFIRHDILEYIASGCADDLTMQRNRQRLDDIPLQARLLQDFQQANTHTTLFGQPLAHPLLLGPVAHQQLVHPAGELATAEAAAAMATPMVVSTLASTTLETIASHHQGALWFQLYWQHDRSNSLALVQRAERSGYQVLVITLDAPVNGLRNRPQRAKFQLPDGVIEANLQHQPRPAQRTLSAEQSIILNGIMADAPTLDDLLWLRQQTRLPIVIKGVINPADAVALQAAGFDGLIVSNHGGRTLDGLPASIDALPAIRCAVGADFPVLMDSGIRRGTDVFKALALGANAVLVGRPQLYALAVAGALGVAHMLKILQDELEMTMALAGCPTIAHIQADALADR
ncbi:alpha-hydroxy acid oxidase [Oceanobacter antarcticus]|uniref:Alpha-hydroxy acid oxidase n=1 Tax=Oceanobacter antarcticus TaxID=3133425 RepID=A0ABW8NDD1_9GAMM